MSRASRIDFARVAAAALASSDAILARWLPDGKRDGAEWIARNPTRADARPGSFKINLRTAKWSDFATGARGGDLISIAAYLYRLDQRQAAINIAQMLGIDPFER